MTTFIVTLEIQALNEAEAKEAAFQLQDLVIKLGRPKTMGLLANKNTLLANPMLNMTLANYAKKYLKAPLLPRPSLL